MQEKSFPHHTLAVKAPHAPVTVSTPQTWVLYPVWGFKGLNGAYRRRKGGRMIAEDISAGWVHCNQIFESPGLSSVTIEPSTHLDGSPQRFPVPYGNVNTLKVAAGSDQRYAVPMRP